jgi:serine/threonine-protein kinase RsbW
MVSTTREAFRQESLGRRGGEIENFSFRAEIPRVLESVAIAMTEQRYAANDMFAVRLALEEALVNALRHGNQEDPAKAVHVSFLVGPERVLIDVQDDGAGFIPSEVPDPLDPENLERSTGRGLHLMRSYMTWVRFNARGNCVTMCKSRGRAHPDERGL